MTIQIQNTLSNDGYTITNASAYDVREVASLDELAQPAPWSEWVFKKERENSHSYIWVVRNEAAVLAGFLCFWLIADEIHILNLVVHPKFRKRGIASGLMDALIMSLNAARIPIVSMTLEVRESNEAALGLYRKFGFQKVGSRKGYYNDNGECAIIMTRAMEEPSDW